MSNEPIELIAEINEFEIDNQETGQTDISYARLDADGLKTIKNGKTEVCVSAKSYNGHQLWKDRTFPWNRR
jgi:hypothetical protein